MWEKVLSFTTNLFKNILVKDMPVHKSSKKGYLKVQNIQDISKWGKKKLQQADSR